MQALPPTGNTMLKLERFANHILRFSTVLFVGYFICCAVAVPLFAIQLSQQPSAYSAHTYGLETVLMTTCYYLLAAGILPITIVVSSASVLSVLMRNRSWRTHLIGVIVASLPVPIILSVIFAMEGDKGLMHLLFVPALSSALGIVWTTRKLKGAGIG
jgi:hypothetical protein